MKLLVVCFGAAIAASVVAAQIGGNKDTAAGVASEPEECDEGNYYFGDNCMYAEEGDQYCWDDRMFALGYEADGYCCGDNAIAGNDDFSEVNDFCANTGDCNPEEPKACGRCVHKKIPIPPPPPPPCPCTTSCCREKSSLDELFADSELFEKWTTLNTQEDAVFIGDDVGFCRTYQQKIQLENDTAVNGTNETSTYVAEFTCYDLCCDCCNNLDIASCEPARELIFKEVGQVTTAQAGGGAASDATITMQPTPVFVFENGYVRQKAAAAKTTNFPGPAAICVYEDSMVLFTHSLGVVAFESASSFTGHRVSVGCPKKQDGSNAGFVVPEQNSTESTSAPAPTPIRTEPGL